MTNAFALNMTITKLNITIFDDECIRIEHDDYSMKHDDLLMTNVKVIAENKALSQ